MIKPSSDDEQAIRGIFNAKELNGAGENRGQWHVIGGVAVGQSHQIGADVDDTDGQQHLNEVALAVHSSQQAEIKDEADGCGNERREITGTTKRSRPVS